MQAKFSGLAWQQVDLIDGEGNSPEDIRRAVDYLEALARTHKVLVHCAEGVSRSPFIVACYLARAERKKISVAIAEVAEKRPRTRIDAGLLKMAQLLETQS
ncbi:MAG: dual specificity protein phosphatase family protein [Chloroflexi bacterium]|nr:dual specificity protein phosphatase family protein [Chloroflexota bacterium]